MADSQCGEQVRHQLGMVPFLRGFGVLRTARGQSENVVRLGVQRTLCKVMPSSPWRAAAKRFVSWCRAIDFHIKPAKTMKEWIRVAGDIRKILDNIACPWFPNGEYHSQWYLRCAMLVGPIGKRAARQDASFTSPMYFPDSQHHTVCKIPIVFSLLPRHHPLALGAQF